MKQYFTTQKETIFKNVEVLIYVFDVEKEVQNFATIKGNPIRRRIEGLQEHDHQPLNFFAQRHCVCSYPQN